jgi:alginate O-acetyltransferase complex protein AlgI
MLFCTQPFLFFFLTVFALYWAMPWRRGRVWLLVAASFTFYALWNKWLAGVVLVSALLDFLVALGMEAATTPGRRRLLLGASLGANLGLLAYFKYSNFFLRSLEEMLRSAGLEASLPVLSVLMPVGISFYTFEAINYTVEVYRGRMRAERNPANFLLFILFFPHLVAGPIVRARDFLQQVRRPKRWNWERVHLGGRLILLGLLKKLALADRMVAYVDPVFADPSQFSAATLWLATVAYALQLYGDFSGYSDMAIGLAQLLGYKLTPNFNLPYLSPNMAEFWRRWHISLSSWIRDYVFVPLGGSKGTALRTARNLLVTMALCGLWHGAAWNYVLFGAVQGAILVAHRAFRGWAGRRPGWFQWLQTSPGTVLRVAATFALFCYTLVIFRCPTLGTAAVMLRRLLAGADGGGLPLRASGLWLTFAAVLACHLLGRSGRWELSFRRLPAPVRGLAYSAALTLALVAAPDAGKAFIYFQF